MNTYKLGSSNIILSDYPDLDVIRVDDTYYMVSTTMHFFPGCVILKSYNLLDWEFCTYVYDYLDNTEAQRLKDNCGIYGKGMWAASLRYNNGIFYICFVCNDTHKTYLYTSDSIQGPWKKSEIQGFYHDMSLLFEDDGRVFVVSGNTEIWLTELSSDLTGPKKDGVKKLIIQDDKNNVSLGYEGCHFYKINGKYYIFMIHAPKGKMRTEACYVSDSIEGPYTGGDVLCSDLGGWNSGVAQGGIVQSNDGKWFGILFQDHGALGRIPVLVSVKFNENGFPEFGENGIVPPKISVLDNRPDYKYKPLFSNDFTDSCWQWNHTPDFALVDRIQSKYSIKTDKTVTNLIQASNTLTQRTFTEKCSGSVFIDAQNLKNGDFAGLAALEGEYAFIAITKENDNFYLITAEHKIPYSPWTMGVFDNTPPDILQKILITSPKLQLKLEFCLQKTNQSVRLLYKDEAANDFMQIGNPSSLRYTLDQFVGVRFALFCYSTKNLGGKAEFSNFSFNVLQ